jgi:hypothetical protein
MRKFFIFLCLGYLVIGTASRAASQQTVADILASCSSKEKSTPGSVEMFRDFFCTGYLTGLFDAFVLTSEFVKTGVPAEKLQLCTPAEGIQGEKIVAIALERMRNEPDLKLSARMAAFAAWKAAFKCN